LTNAQLVDYDLTGFTEVKGKKKKEKPTSQQNQATVLTKIDQQKNYFNKYQYEEKKTKTSPLPSSKTSQQATVSKTYDSKEKSLSNSGSKPDSSLKEKPNSTSTQRSKSDNQEEALRDANTQQDLSSTYSSQSRQNSNPPELKSLEIELSKSDSKKNNKPLRLNPSAPPIKISPELETQKKLALTKVVNQLVEDRVERDIENYVEKLNDESNLLEDFRRVTFNRLKHIIVGALPDGRNVSIKPYGSCVTGLALNFSDIDIAISGVYATDREHLLHLLQSIHDKLKVFDWVKEPKVISTASLPVLKIEAVPSIDITSGDYAKDPILKKLMDKIPDKLWYDMNLKPNQKDEKIQIRIDISIEDGYFGHLGVVSTEFVAKMIERYESLYSMTQKELLNKHQGGISSYCLVVMLVAYLQTCNQHGIAKNFLGCVEFYGREFDPKTTGINLILEPSPFYKFMAHPDQSPFYLFDKLRFDRNLGHTTTKLDQILKEFRNIDEYFRGYRQSIETIVTQQTWISMQQVDHKFLHSQPELQSYKNKNLFDEIFRLSKSQ